MRRLIPFLTLLILSGCAAKPDTTLQLNSAADAELSPQPLTFYTDRLAVGLFGQAATALQAVNSRPMIAVTSFLPLEQLNLSAASAEEVQLANQLAENMLSYTVQHGMQVVDIRLLQQVRLHKDHEQALGRQVAALKQQSAADAVLTGTYVVQEDALVVNARLIDVQTNQVIAAATDYIPINVFWSEQQVMKRGQHLYRHSTNGDRK